MKTNNLKVGDTVWSKYPLDEYIIDILLLSKFTSLTRKKDGVCIFVSDLDSFITDFDELHKDACIMSVYKLPIKLYMHYKAVNKDYFLVTNYDNSISIIKWIFKYLSIEYKRRIV